MTTNTTTTLQPHTTLRNRATLTAYYTFTAHRTAIAIPPAWAFAKSSKDEHRGLSVAALVCRPAQTPAIRRVVEYSPKPPHYDTLAIHLSSHDEGCSFVSWEHGPISKNGFLCHLFHSSQDTDIPPMHTISWPLRYIGRSPTGYACTSLSADGKGGFLGYAYMLTSRRKAMARGRHLGPRILR